MPFKCFTRLLNLLMCLKLFVLGDLDQNRNVYFYFHFQISDEHKQCCNTGS